MILHMQQGISLQQKGYSSPQNEVLFLLQHVGLLQNGRDISPPYKTSQVGLQGTHRFLFTT